MSVYKDQLNQFVSELDVQADTLLDIGGSQNPLNGRTRSWQVRDYKIVDLKEPHVTVQSPDIAADMNEPAPPELKLYFTKVDTIFMLGVMDYVINPLQALRTVYDLLKPTGSAWIEWPLFYCHHEPIMEEGLRYSEGCINRLLGQSKLNIDTMIRKPAGNPHLVQFFQEDGQRMSRNYRYHDTVGFITKVIK